MDIDKLLSTLPQDVRDSASWRGLVVFIQTLSEELAQVQIQDQISGRRTRSTSETAKGPENSALTVNTSLVKKELSEMKVLAENVPEGCRFKGYQNFTIQKVGLIAKEIT